MKFRKKPVVIEAIQWTGHNYDEIIEFMNGKLNRPEWPTRDCLKINTLEGDMLCSIKDWIIKGVKGEFYPCKPDIFEQTYELIVEIEDEDDEDDDDCRVKFIGFYNPSIVNSGEEKIL